MRNLNKVFLGWVLVAVAIVVSFYRDLSPALDRRGALSDALAEISSKPSLNLPYVHVALHRALTQMEPVPYLSIASTVLCGIGAYLLGASRKEEIRNVRTPKL